MANAMFYANDSFLIEDPDFAVDFAPNGRMAIVTDEFMLMLHRNAARPWRDDDQEEIWRVSSAVPVFGQY